MVVAEGPRAVGIQPAPSLPGEVAHFGGRGVLDRVGMLYRRTVKARFGGAVGGALHGNEAAIAYDLVSVRPPVFPAVLVGAAHRDDAVVKERDLEGVVFPARSGNDARGLGRIARCRGQLGATIELLVGAGVGSTPVGCVDMIAVDLAQRSACWR
jgi:hypothetical protein